MLTYLLDDLSSSLIPFKPVDTKPDGFFKLPNLEADSKGSGSDINEVSDETRTTAEISDGPEPESLNDVWMDLDSLPDKTAQHRAWDAFLSGTAATKEPPLISEAGPAVYDAILGWSIDPLHLNSYGVPVVEAKPYLASLLALAIGQESILFIKQGTPPSFAPALPKMRISGYSRDVLQGLEKQCFSCGSTFLELRSFVQSTYSKSSTKSRVALASSLEKILKVAQEHVSVYGRDPRSLLELRSTIQGLLAILEPFRRLASKLHRRCSDEFVLSTVFQEAYSVESGDDRLREIMREVLRGVSRPWVEFLEEWIGTRREYGIPFTRNSVGESKGFVKVEMETYMDDFGQEVEDVDFRLNEDKMPDFMPRDISKSVFETGKNLRFIRSCHPDHPLAKPNIIASTQPPAAEWLYEWDSILRLESRVVEYRNNLIDAIEKSGINSDNPTQTTGISFDLHRSNELQFFGVETSQIEQQILASIDHFNQPLSNAPMEDSLGQVVRDRLSGPRQPPSGLVDFAPHWSLLPVLSFGSIAAAQSDIINRESLKLLFSHHDLRSHLKLHRDFHLFGDGMFSSRLSHALFDSSLETAERTAGVARQGGVMGLRLSGRDTWPPASSELRLALMGVLVESFGAGNPLIPGRTENLSGDSSDLPGDLSFGVRDLSQDEIDKCMNPDSLEALDFLRLSYKTPDALSSIITPMILVQYDRIFKLLLRVLRLLYVVNQLSHDLNTRSSRWDDPDATSYRFAREAHHFVTGTASYYLDIGVAIPWQALDARLDKIQNDLSKPYSKTQSVNLEGPDRLREYHSQVLDRIMLALFLRKRQQPVLKLLEEIFKIILDYAKFARMQALHGKTSDHDGQHSSEMYKKFKKRVQIFITVCRGLTEKRGLGSNKADDLGFKQDGTGEDHMVAQLLMKLDMNGHYSKH